MKLLKSTISEPSSFAKSFSCRVLCLSVLLPAILSGCGTSIAPGFEKSQQQETAARAEASSSSVPGSLAPDGSASESSQDKSVDSPYPERNVTQEELLNFNLFLNEHDNKTNYGFLLSEYSRPQEVDLNEVLYNGIGEPPLPVSDQEKEAYSKAAGSDITTDCTKLTTKMIDDFLMKKINLTLEDIISDFNWVYLKDFDSWYFDHGDTNYTTFTCASGRQIGEDTYQLEFASDSDFYSDCQVVLKQSGDTYLFVSNTFIPKIENRNYVWLIEDQSFDINLNKWANVTFASYEPDFNRFPTGDAVFTIIQNGKTVFLFPPVYTDNLRTDTSFEGVDAVGFKDYNEDGYTDVVIICKYSPTAGPDMGVSYNEVRLYKGYEKDFVLDSDLSSLVNYAHKNTSVKEAVLYIQETYPGGFLPRLE